MIAIAVVVVSLAFASPALAETASPAAAHTISGHVSVGDKSHPATFGYVSVSYLEKVNGVWQAGDGGAYTSDTGAYALDVGTADTVIVLAQNRSGDGLYLNAQTADENGDQNAPGILKVTTDLSGIDLTMPTAGTLDGVVLDASGAPAASVLVTLYMPSAGNTYSGDSNRTGPDGVIHMAHLAPGSYVLVMQDASGGVMGPGQYYGGSAARPTAATAMPISVALSQHITGFVAHFAQLGSVTGSIVCDTCSSVDTLSIGIDVFDQQNSQWVPIDANFSNSTPGSFTYDGLFPGTYRIELVYTGPNDFRNQTSAAIIVGDGAAVVTSFILARPATGATGVDARTSSFLTALYFDYLNRRPAGSDVNFWGKYLASGSPRSSVAAGFVNSDEYRLIRITEAYHTVLNRGPDPAGPQNWLAAMKRGDIQTDDVEQSFYASQEFYARAGSSDLSWSAALYQVLLGRQPAYSEAAGWANLTRMYGRDWVVHEFWRAHETAKDRVAAMYTYYLGRQPDPAGLDGWTTYALRYGDSATRAQITGSDEYFNRAQTTYPASTSASAPLKQAEGQVGPLSELAR
ncbi:DUF4214 domain-containing protein [Subtercola vilae]|nr:DUF4214 domain-containing protein [Subtercola vilae]